MLSSLQDFVREAPVPAELVERYQAVVPKELLQIWQEFGFGTFFEGYLRVINPDDYLELIRQTYFRGDVAIPILVTAFGEIITWEKGQYVTLVSYSKGNCEIMITRFDLFLCLLKDQGFLKRFFPLPLYRQAVARLGIPGYRECFGYVPLLALGGRERAENLSLVKTREHLHLIAELTGGI